MVRGKFMVQHYVIYNTNIAKLAEDGENYFGNSVEEYSKIHELYLVRRKIEKN